MRYINGCTFAFMSPRGFTQKEEWKRSLRLMVESTGCDTVILPVGALQDHCYSTKVDYTTPDVMSMDDVRAVADEVRKLGLHLVVKAMVNVRDGYWRAYIRFFDTYVPTEPTWEQWFASYDEFVVELAKTAQEVGAEMFCLGCEMVGTDHRADEWRDLIAQVRKVYHGPLTYNCDKFQEHHVTWWDAVDAISSSGYYPIDQLEEHFQRVEAVAEKFNKPFFFMESGCPSREGSEYIPNNWNYGGEQSNEAQARWYQAYTDMLIKHSKIRGSVWWDWSAIRLYPIETAATNNGYCTYGKPAEKILQAYSRDIAERESK
ncbi:MAG: 1,4-beta-xylanase [Clostridia bacterium]|nr:1,4-beta-xylanase [Clostridia bacterium]